MDDLIARLPVSATLRTHLKVIFYLLQLLLILIYLEAEVQPFVYVRF